jgi:hypothetical protein
VVGDLCQKRSQNWELSWFYIKIHKIWRFTEFDFLDYQGFSVCRFSKPIVIGYTSRFTEFYFLDSQAFLPNNSPSQIGLGMPLLLSLPDTSGNQLYRRNNSGGFFDVMDAVL